MLTTQTVEFKGENDFPSPFSGEGGRRPGEGTSEASIEQLNPLPKPSPEKGEGELYLKKVSASFSHSGGTVLSLAVASWRETPITSLPRSATIWPNWPFATSSAALAPTRVPRIRSNRVGPPPR